MEGIIKRRTVDQTVQTQHHKCKGRLSQRCVDTGLTCCSNRLHYQPSTDRVFCGKCAPHGRDIRDLPEELQQLILEAVIHA